MFETGNKVKVVDPGASYSRYLQYLAGITQFLESEDVAKFRYNKTPEKGEELEIVHSGRHPDHYKEKLYVCVNSEHLFIMGEEGLALVSTEVEQGSIVRCIETDRFYRTYSMFMIEHYDELRALGGFQDSLFWSYAYNEKPVQDKARLYKVLVIAPHTDDWAEGRQLAICQDKETGKVYIFDLDALEVVQ